MHNHWDKNLNVKALLEEWNPEFIVEMGAGSGHNTKQYLDFLADKNISLVVISDGKCPDDLKKHVKDLSLNWIFGVSYLKLEDFMDESIDFCSIDTDHNYWTLKKELEVLYDKLCPNGIVVIHDTMSYKDSSGRMDHYNCKENYPMDIVNNELAGKKYVDAISEVLGKSFSLIRENKESCGAVALQKKG